jgi:hypothetical protein
VYKILRLPIIVILLHFVLVNSAFSQIGGKQTYQFLNLTNSARVAGMGGDFLTVRDNDLTLTLANPSLITPEMDNNLSMSYINYFGGLNYGYVMYAKDFKKTGGFVGTLQYINYGTFTAADETSTITGEFGASEYALNIGWAKKLSPLFFIGANGKLIYSQLDTYNSFGIAVDVAGTYQSKNELFTASIIGKNIGTQIVAYRDGNREPLPFELQAGISQRFKHVPLRLSVLYNHLEKWDLSYEDPNDPENQKDPITGETESKTGIAKFGDNFMRHIVVGAELTIAKVLAVRLGYNYQRRQEMKVYNHVGLSGFSGGLGLRIKMFSFSYSRAIYETGSLNPNYFTLTMNLNGFKKQDSPPKEN